MRTKSTRDRRLGLVLLVALLIVAAACSDDPEIVFDDPEGTSIPTTTSPTTSSTVAPATAPTVSAESPCTPEPAGAIGLFGGGQIVVRSPATPVTAPRRAVIMLHGFGGSPADVEATTGWTSFVASRDAVVAYPQARPLFGGGFGWNSGAARASNPGADDVPAILATYDLLVERFCVDPGAVVLAGESNGGAMAVRVACDVRSAGRFVLVAPAISAIDGGVTTGCAEASPVDLYALAGRLDETATYDGVYPPGVAPWDAQQVWFERVAGQLNRCTPSSTTEVAIPGGVLLEPGGCAARTTMIAVTDGRHTWPGGPVGTGGMDSGVFDASTAVWTAAFG